MISGQVMMSVRAGGRDAARRASIALSFVALCMFAPTGFAAPGEAAMDEAASVAEAVIQRDGKVAVVSTSADGVRRYSIKAAPAGDFNMRIGQTVRPIADLCGDALMPR